MYRSTPIHKIMFTALLLGIAALGSPAFAGHDNHSSRAQPQAILSAEASSEVGQDTVHLSLAAEVTADSQSEAAKKLNQRLDQAMKQAKAKTGIEARSGNYHVWPGTDRDGRVTQWRGNAEIILESQDFSAAAALAASLSDITPISGMFFSVSPQLRAAEEQKLLVQAIEAFKTRAQALAQALGFAGYEYVKIDLGGSGAMSGAPMPRMMRALAVSADSAAAPVEGGRETISVSVQGTISLVPAEKGPGQ